MTRHSKVLSCPLRCFFAFPLFVISLTVCICFSVALFWTEPKRASLQRYFLHVCWRPSFLLCRRHCLRPTKRTRSVSFRFVRVRSLWFSVLFVHFVFFCLEPSRGRILIFSVGDNKLKLAAEAETKGAVYSLLSFTGKLLAGINSKVMYFLLRNLILNFSPSPPLLWCFLCISCCNLFLINMVFLVVSGSIVQVVRDRRGGAPVGCGVRSPWSHSLLVFGKQRRLHCGRRFDEVNLFASLQAT